MSDFGYDKYDGEPYVRLGGKWYSGDGLVVAGTQVTPVQVVGPGQVAVDADAARQAEQTLRLGNLPHTAAHFRAALAAAEPTPDSGQGETDPAASGGGLEADGDQSERVEFCRNCAKCGMEVWGLRPGGICFKCHDDTPAAEPDRVTLPNTPWTTVNVVLDNGDGWVWQTKGGDHYYDLVGIKVSPERIARVVDFAILAQPPETPDETYERGEDSGSCGECGVWTDARTWGACPECFAKADPAETDAPTDWLSYINEKAEAEAKRGRDEALAVVVKALRERREDFGRSSTRLDAFDLTALAEAIEREAGRSSDVTDGRTDDLTSSRLGGDGHE